MKNKYLVRVIAFALVTIMILTYVSNLLQSKWTVGVSETYVIDDMYELKENTIDVCILGSSQFVYGISSMQLLEEYGISAFSCCTASQPMICTYFYLKEMLKTQDVKTVILETSMLYEKEKESFFRKTADSVPLSSNKLEMLLNHCKDNSWEDFWSYIFPIMQYHSRWNELEENDFTYKENDNKVFRGNIATGYKVSVNESDIVVDNELENEPETMVPVQEKYCRKILDFCNEKDINVILVKTPKESWRGERTLGVQSLADEYGLDFLDFNKKELLDELKLDFNKDFGDPDHLNARGTMKLTSYIGDYLNGRYQYDDAREAEEFDEQMMNDFLTLRNFRVMQTSSTVEEILSYLEEQPYEILLMNSTDIAEQWTSELQGALKKLGVTKDVRELSGCNYVAHLKNGKVVYENASDIAISYTGSFSDETEFILQNDISNVSTNALMKIDNEDKVFSEKGLNVYVYLEDFGGLTKTFSICFENGDWVLR